MPRLIIPQPDGKFSFYSTDSNTFTRKDLSKSEIIQIHVKVAKERAETRIIERLKVVFNKIKTGNNIMTYEDALANHNENTP